MKVQGAQKWPSLFDECKIFPMEAGDFAHVLKGKEIYPDGSARGLAPELLGLVLAGVAGLASAEEGLREPLRDLRIEPDPRTLSPRLPAHAPQPGVVSLPTTTPGCPT